MSPDNRLSPEQSTADQRRRGVSQLGPGMNSNMARGDVSVAEAARRAGARKKIETEFLDLKDVAEEYGLTETLPKSASIDSHDPDNLTVRVPDLDDSTGRRGKRIPYGQLRAALAQTLARRGINLERELAERRNESWE